jgi:hypothetical protein
VTTFLIVFHFCIIFCLSFKIFTAQLRFLKSSLLLPFFSFSSYKKEIPIYYIFFAQRFFIFKNFLVRIRENSCLFFHSTTSLLFSLFFREDSFHSFVKNEIQNFCPLKLFNVFYHQKKIYLSGVSLFFKGFKFVFFFHF